MAPPDGAPTPFVRDAMLERLRSETFDVVVVGGGITGAWVALEATMRGLRTALVERDDLASGTSSKSSKLIHGGLRYLQNGDVRLVYEALHERRRLMRAAPHLVSVLPFMIPVLTRDGLFPKKVAKALGSALWMYDLTGGWRIGRLHRRLDAAQARAHLPTMPSERLAGGYRYYDAAADDARLTLTVARTAAEHGAVVVTRCPVVGLLPDDAGATTRPVDGVVVAPDGDRIEVAARVVVNATGVWADDLARLEDPARATSIRPAKGVHVTVPWELVRNDIAVVVPVRQDKRSLFIIPWGDRGDGTFRSAYVGTTDTDHDGSLDDPQCDVADLDYVLRALNDAIASGPDARTITIDDVTAVWAGLRPLLTSASSAATADLSRNHRVSVGPRGVVDIAGGKLTTGRLMAEHTIDEVEDRLGRGRSRLRRSPTRRLRLHGAIGELGDAGSRVGHLRRRYGTEADAVLELVRTDPTLGDPLVPGLPFLRAEAVHAVRDEMALTLTDVLTRRTRCHLEDRDATEAAAPAVAALLAGELGWDDAETARQLDAYREMCEAERRAAATTAGRSS